MLYYNVYDRASARPAPSTRSHVLSSVRKDVYYTYTRPAPSTRSHVLSSVRNDILPVRLEVAPEADGVGGCIEGPQPKPSEESVPLPTIRRRCPEPVPLRNHRHRDRHLKQSKVSSNAAPCPSPKGTESPHLCRGLPILPSPRVEFKTRGSPGRGVAVDLSHRDPDLHTRRNGYTVHRTLGGGSPGNHRGRGGEAQGLQDHSLGDLKLLQEGGERLAL